MSAETDAALLAESVGRPAVFAGIFDRHADTVLRFLTRRVGPEAAEDLLGEVFRIAFERRGSYDPSHPVARPWLYGIATNLLARHRRGEARRLRATARFAAQRSPEAHLDDGVIDAVDAQRRWARVAGAVAGLPGPERDVLLLYAWEELSYQDIAAALDVPVGTVRSRLNRARARLRALSPATTEQPGRRG